MLIRAGSVADIPFIRDLTERATRSTYYIEGMGAAAEAVVARYVAISPKVFEAAIGSSDCDVFVAADENDLVQGYVVTKHDAPEIDWIMVDPAAHGSGAGKALMSAGLAALTQHCPGKPIRLSVVAHNERAKAFYRKFGFEVTGPLTGRDIPTLEMQRLG